MQSKTAILPLPHGAAAARARIKSKSKRAQQQGASQKIRNYKMQRAFVANKTQRQKPILLKIINKKNPFV